ncbi:hypothetical protein [Vibrio barjaei]|uniref:hypothetical protein n=1 Tax=Vibrio barjaei TaxID=1676683 RepID=UPI0022836E19|nr:hypothetical protein [Vibrio barjaei]MCY9870376.1 hypothetical protein [Vibrio barjaei]
MKQLQSTWLEHPWANTQQKVEEIPCEILQLLSNKSRNPSTDDIDGVIKHESEVFDSIEEQGLRDPLLIVINKEEMTIRLESGNHRIYEALKRGYSSLPTATLVHPSTIINAGNGKHTYNAEGIVDFEAILEQPYPYQIKLTDYLLPRAVDFDFESWVKHLCIN